MIRRRGNSHRRCTIRDVPLDALRREIGSSRRRGLLFSDTCRKRRIWRRGRCVREMGGANSSDGFYDRGFPWWLRHDARREGDQCQRSEATRVAARALARKPSIVAADDALSAVDTHNRSRHSARAPGRTGRRTAVISSHRASSIRHATKIIVATTADCGRRSSRGADDERGRIGHF